MPNKIIDLYVENRKLKLNVSLLRTQNLQSNYDKNLKIVEESIHLCLTEVLDENTEQAEHCVFQSWEFFTLGKKYSDFLNIVESDFLKRYNKFKEIETSISLILPARQKNLKGSNDFQLKNMVFLKIYNYFMECQSYEDAYGLTETAIQYFSTHKGNNTSLDLRAQYIFFFKALESLKKLITEDSAIEFDKTALCLQEIYEKYKRFKIFCSSFTIPSDYTEEKFLSLCQTTVSELE